MYSGDINNEIGTKENTGSETIQENIINGESLENIYCEKYKKKNDCEDIQECKRDKKEKKCTIEDTIYMEEKYELDIVDSIIQPTPTDITVTSQKTKQKINGYLKIHKDMQMETDSSESIITLQSPSLITDYELLGTNEKEGIPDNFTHLETVQVGDPINHITTT